MFLQISIPSDSDLIQRPVCRVNSHRNPIETDTGWFTVFYDQLDYDEIGEDLSYRIRFITEEYQFAIDEGYFDDETLERNLQLERIVLEEYEKVWRYLSNKINQLMSDRLTAHSIYKLKFLQGKDDFFTKKS